MSGINFTCRALATVQVLALAITLSPLPFAQGKIKIPETVYSNPQAITINTASGLTAPTAAATYPSNIAVSGMSGTVTRVAVTLTGVTHPNFANLDFLLVSPSGAKFIFASDLTEGGGNGIAIDDRVFTFADNAPTSFPLNGNTGVPSSGAYKPTSGDGIADAFPAPAPAGPYIQPASGFAAAFNGTAPNGIWSLYVADDALGNAGSISDGWSLEITTDLSPITTFANANYLAINDVITAANPYGTTINVSGATGAISNLKVTLTGFSHTTPQDVDILLVSPNGRGLILLSDAGGTTAASGANLTFDDAAAAAITTVVSGTFKPTDVDVEIFDTFPAPAPLRPYIRSTFNNQLSNFNGYSPNGDWRLYVVDDALNNAGSISGGWSLDITTTPIVPPPPSTCAAPSFSPMNFSVGANPTNVAVADFNNDTKPDLAVTNQVSNDVSILLNNGNGTYGTQSLVSAGTGPYSIVAGKFNADNNFDLAVANSSSNNVSILLGNGNGTFSAPANFFVGPSPISIASGDFNGDTKPDLVVANFGGFFSGSVSLLIGNGSGGFTTGNTVRTRTQPSYVTVLDFNGDAKQDIVVANFGADSVSTFAGSGSGTFQLVQNLGAGSGPVAIEAADFIGNDGIKDLAIANYNSDNLTFCTGFASGQFNCTPNGTWSANPISISSGAFLGGATSLAVALSGSNLVRVVTSAISVGQNPNAVRTADLNVDGKPDLVSVNSGSNDVSVLLNSCIVATGNLFDFNGDRRTDYTVFRPSGTNWWLSPQANPVKNLGRPTDRIVPADYNGDKLTDYAIYRPENNLWFVIDSFNGKPIYYLQFGVAQDIAAPADYDGDGKTDIAVWRPSDGNWYIRRSTDNVTQVTGFGMNGDTPAPADYDGDGKDDIAVFRGSTGVWYIVRSSDSQLVIQQFGMNGDKTVQADYEGDGKADIAIWRPSNGAWYVLKSSDAGVLSYNWGMFGDIPAPGDYDGDGKFDFAVWRPTDGFWYVVKSSDGSPVYTPWGLNGDIPIPSAFVR